MLVNRRSWLGLVGGGLLMGSVQAREDGVPLQETVGVGSTFQYDIALLLEGKMKVTREGRQEAIPLVAKASHRFLERVENPDARGGVGRSLRYYSEAKSESTTGPERQVRELPESRRLILASRSTQGTVHISPDGPLSRDELELVAEHFDTLALTGLLPQKVVHVGDTWTIDTETAQYVCLFEGLLKAELTGKLLKVENQLATFSISGTAEGVETGAMAKVTINATASYDLVGKRLTELTWEQQDERQQGPVSPASEFKAVVRLKRAAVPEDVKELAADVRAKAPAEIKPEHLILRYADAAGRYSVALSRDWHIAGRTPNHLVLRLLDNGEMAAQMTLTAWKKAAPGEHISPEEFRKIIAAVPGWQPEQQLRDGPLSVDGGRWLYRIVAQGKQDGVPVVQVFYMLAGPQGDQIAATVLTHADKASKLQGRDEALIKAIEFPAAK